MLWILVFQTFSLWQVCCEFYLILWGLGLLPTPSPPPPLSSSTPCPLAAFRVFSLSWTMSVFFCYLSCLGFSKHLGSLAGFSWFLANSQPLCLQTVLLPYYLSLLLCATPSAPKFLDTHALLCPWPYFFLPLCISVWVISTDLPSSTMSSHSFFSCVKCTDEPLKGILLLWYHGIISCISIWVSLIVSIFCFICSSMLSTFSFNRVI